MDQSIDLLIKTADQQCPDCNVTCNLTWTINDLKLYLSTVYPGELKEKDQKLIYGGKVLTDDTVLSTVFNPNNNYNYSNVVHLVRTNLKVSANSQLKAKSMNMPKSGPTTSTPAKATPTPPLSEPQSPQYAFSSPVARQQYLLSLHQMHHAYFQYMHSYQQLYYNQNLFQQSNQNLAQIPRHNSPEMPNTVDGHPIPLSEQLQVQGQQQPNRINRIQNVAAENREMDYFDIFCAMIRACIIVVLFYSYSSLFRFAIVIFTIIIVGLFKYFRVTRLEFDRREDEQPQPQPQAEPEPDEEPISDPLDENQALVPTTETNVSESRRDILNTVWLFITSFLASLIPDTVEVA